MTTSGDRQVLSADGQTVARKFVGPVRVSYSGTFGGGTAKIQAEDPSGVFIDVDGTSKTAVADFVIDFPPRAVNLLQTDLSGAITPSLKSWIQGTDVGSGAL